VDPRAGIDDVEKRIFLTLPGLELRPLGRPASSQSLYRLRYSAPDRIGRLCKEIKTKKTHLTLLSKCKILNTLSKGGGGEQMGIIFFKNWRI
jgi:hypothetical protein